MKKGDLIALEEGERGGEWLTGSNVLTGDWGEFPAANVRVLPTILQPPLHIVVLLTPDNISSKEYIINGYRIKQLCEVVYLITILGRQSIKAQHSKIAKSFFSLTLSVHIDV